MGDNAKTYVCNDCNYVTLRKTNYERHLSSTKHIEMIILKKKELEALVHKAQIIKAFCEEQPKFNKKYKCKNCDKHYSHTPSLYRHQKECVVIDNSQNSQVVNTQTQPNIHSIANNLQHSNYNNIHNNPVNCHNNIVNVNNMDVQMFVNTHCNEAINLQDFFDNIKITLTREQIERYITNDYFTSTTSILDEYLAQLGILKRPLHCCDIKRKIFYLRINDEWIKDNGNIILIKFIKQLPTLLYKSVDEWRLDHPHCKDPSHKDNDRYLNLLNNSLPASSVEESEESINKLLRYIANKYHWSK